MSSVIAANAQEAWLDAQFAAMETDEDYRSLQLAIAEEFMSLDREAWRWRSWFAHLSSA